MREKKEEKYKKSYHFQTKQISVSINGFHFGKPSGNTFLYRHFKYSFENIQNI
jgi:hypothetical protein